MHFTFRVMGAIFEHVFWSPWQEVGGLLFGDDETVTGMVPVPNAAADPERAFEISPDYFARALAQGEREAELVGTFHSHPRGSAQMSTEDVLMALSTGLLLIIAPEECWEWALYDPVERRQIELVIDTPFAKAVSQG